MIDNYKLKLYLQINVLLLQEKNRDTEKYKSNMN